MDTLSGEERAGWSHGGYEAVQSGSVTHHSQCTGETQPDDEDTRKCVDGCGCSVSRKGLCCLLRPGHKALESSSSAEPCFLSPTPRLPHVRSSHKCVDAVSSEIISLFIHAFKKQNSFKECA